MRKLLDINEGTLLEGGLYPSVSDNQPLLWKSGKNIDFRDRKVIKTLGYDVQESLLSPVYALAQSFNDGVQRIYYAQQDSIWSYEAGVSTRIGTGFATDPKVGTGYWSLETWGKWLIATDNVNPVQVWKDGAADSMAPLADFRRDKAKLIKKHKNHVLAYWGQSVDWSSDSNAELWEPDDNNSAGGQYLRDLDSDIIAAQPLGQAFAVYSSDKMTIQQYIGEPFFFSFGTSIEGIGAVSDFAIISVGNKNYGMSKKGFFETDGIGFNYIDTPAIKDWFKERFSEPLSARTVGLHDEERSTVKWWFPCADGMICGCSFNYAKRSWSILDQPVTAAVPLEVFNFAIIGTDNSWGFHRTPNLGADPMESALQTFPLDAGQRENYKLWDLYRADFKGAGVEIRFGFQTQLVDDDGEELEPEWTEWEPLKVENYIDRESVFLTIELRTTGFDTQWELNGFTVHGEVTGYL